MNNFDMCKAFDYATTSAEFIAEQAPVLEVCQRYSLAKQTILFVLPVNSSCFAPYDTYLESVQLVCQ